MTVYDCCPFWQENDILEIRINEHWSWADKFIVVEAGETHAGNKKPFNFDRERFEKYSEKLIYVTFDSFAEEMAKYPKLNCEIARKLRDNQASYLNDHFQYNYCVKVLEDLGANDHDIVNISCLDEITKPSAFQQALEYFKDTSKTYEARDIMQKIYGTTFTDARPIIWFEMYMYIYKMNLLHIRPTFTHATGPLTEFCMLKRMMPATIRVLNAETHRIQNGGWHFSYMDDTADGAKVIGKMNNWAHSTDILADGTRRIDKKDLQSVIEQLVQEFKLSIPESVVPVRNETHPNYLVNNLEKFENYILDIT